MQLHGVQVPEREDEEDQDAGWDGDDGDSHQGLGALNPGRLRGLTRRLGDALGPVARHDSDLLTGVGGDDHRGLVAVLPTADSVEVIMGSQGRHEVLHRFVLIGCLETK